MKRVYSIIFALGERIKCDYTAKSVFTAPNTYISHQKDIRGIRNSHVIIKLHEQCKTTVYGTPQIKFGSLCE